MTRIGIDIQDVDRIKQCINTSKLPRLFTDREIEYFQSRNWAAETVTGIFCAKEAFFKALGTGVVISQLHEVEILHSSYGAPYYKLSAKIVNEHRLNTAKIQLSISHTKAMAVAVCIIGQHELGVGI